MKHWSLRQNFLLRFIVIIVIPFVIAGYFVMTQLEDRFLEEVYEKNNIVNDLSRNAVIGYLQSAESIVNHMGQVIFESTYGQDMPMGDYIETESAYQEYFTHFEVLDAKGHILTTVPYEESYVGLSRSGYEYYDTEVSSGIGHWTRLFSSSYDYSPSIAYYYKSDDGSFVGYLNVNKLRDYIEEIPKLEKQRVSLLDSKGVYISDADPDLIAEHRRYENYSRIMMEGSNNGKSYITEEDQLVVSIVEADVADWFIVTSTSKEVINERIWTIRLFIFGFESFVILISAYIYLSMIRQVVVPLDLLSEKAETISKGDYNFYIDFISFKEINKLIFHFNTMIKKIKTRDVEIRKMAYYDNLTNLPNRFHMEQIIRSSIDKYGKQHRGFYLIFIDMDNFKLINDTHGHSVGDAFIKVIGEQLSVSLDGGDIIGRFGGDEFIGVFRDSQDVNHIIDIILGIFNKDYFMSGIALRTSASIGISHYPEHGNTVEDILKCADMAMYQAKERGKNQAYIWKDDALSVTLRRLEYENDIRVALKQREFYLVYQPQIDVETGEMRGVEALLRWNHRKHGTISPIEFIPLAEQTGEIVAIGTWVLNESLRQKKEWDRLYDINIKMAINVSPIQIRQSDFVDVVLASIESHKIDPKDVELEITEGVLINSFDHTIDVINRLREKGIRVCLDDFGSEYSSLNYLTSLPIDLLKMDKSFIQEMATDDKKQIVAKTIIKLAHDFKFEVLAEGVEDQQALNYLRDWQCDSVQGYYFSKPVQPREVIEYLKKVGQLYIEET